MTETSPNSALCAIRMAAVRTLFARASQGRFHLRHRRLFLPRHHARRRHADHRDGGHERLPQGAAGQDPRAQRPFAGAAAGIAADRLEGRRRAHQPGAGHPPRGPGRRRPGAGVLGVQRLRRPGPRHARRRSEQPDLDLARTSSRARWRISTKGRASRSAAGSPINCRCMPATASRWWRQRAR